MPATTTVHEARQRLQDCFNRFLDRVAPSNGPLPLTGAKFADWEDLVMREGFEVLAAAMEERAKLDGQSQVEAPGPCPHCGSERTYLEKQSTSNAIRSPVGEIDVQRQQARCRACKGSFSPSESRRVSAGRSAADASRGAAHGARNVR